MLLKVSLDSYTTHCGCVTVIYFAKFDLVGILKVIMVRNEFQPSHQTSLASRISGKIKKAIEGHKEQAKAKG